MNKIKIIHYVKGNQEKVCDISVGIMVIIAGVIALVFGIAENKIGFVISVAALFLVATVGNIAAKAIIKKIVDEDKKSID